MFKGQEVQGCVISQKSADLIYITSEVRNHAWSVSRAWSVVECRRVCCKPLSKVHNGLLPGGLPCESGSWAGRVSWRGVPRRGDADGKTGEYLGLTVLNSVV